MGQVESAGGEGPIHREEALLHGGVEAGAPQAVPLEGGTEYLEPGGNIGLRSPQALLRRREQPLHSAGPLRLDGLEGGLGNDGRDLETIHAFGGLPRRVLPYRLLKQCSPT